MDRAGLVDDDIFNDSPDSSRNSTIVNAMETEQYPEELNNVIISSSIEKN
tara:strand:- start:47 stop:196 length:150 start_codon:yes stop_codon:yes gene_type:complete